jgi:hypothetical protein
VKKYSPCGTITRGRCFKEIIRVRLGECHV